MSTIPESDWKILKNLKKELLSNTCERTFQRIEELSSRRHGREHDAFLELWDLIEAENKSIGEMFDNTRRSNAILKIVALKLHGILTEKQLSHFSSETKQRVNNLTNI